MSAPQSLFQARPRGLANPAQTVLTITFDADLSRADIEDFSRHYAAHISGKPGVSDVRFQLWVGDPLTESDALAVAKTPRKKARIPGYSSRLDGVGLCSVCGDEVPVRLPPKTHPCFPSYVARDHRPRNPIFAYEGNASYFCTGSNSAATSVKTVATSG